MPFFLLLLKPGIVAPQSTPVDPDWLLSSTVQSAAVLVAIVGGFLVSRLVGLSAERGALIQRRHHREELRLIKQDQHNEVHSERLSVSTESFVKHHKDKLLGSNGDADIEALLEDFIPIGSSDREMRPVAEHLVSSMKDAFPAILAKFPGSAPPPLTASELRQGGVVIPDDAVDIYVIVANYIADHMPSARRLAGYTFSFDPPRYALTVRTPPIVYERQDARISKETDLASEIRALEREISLLDEELAEIGKPPGVKWSIAVLAYLILVGIALPTILMALRPVPDNAISRAAVVAAFISGLIVLVMYLVFHVRALKPPPQTVSVCAASRWRVLPNRRQP